MNAGSQSRPGSLAWAEALADTCPTHASAVVNHGYPKAAGPYTPVCIFDDGTELSPGAAEYRLAGFVEEEPVDVTPALNTCEDYAALHYAMAESAGVWGDPAYEDAFASCNAQEAR